MRAVNGTILSLDLSTHTGWAVGAPGGDPIFGTEDLPSTGDNVGKFVCAFEDWMTEVLFEHEPELVIFEGPVLPRTTKLSTIRKLNGLCSETERRCVRVGVRCVEMNVSKLKKWFTGNGRAEKSDMMHMARRWGWKVRTDHEADACGMWAYAVSCYAAPEFAARFDGGPLSAAPLGAAA